MKTRRLTFLSLALVLVVAALWAPLPTASADEPFSGFVSARSNCSSGNYAFQLALSANPGLLGLQTVSTNLAMMPLAVVAVDAEGNPLGQNSHDYAPGLITGSMAFAQQPQGATVTFYLAEVNMPDKISVFLKPSTPYIIDSITVPANCDGCEMYIPLTDAVSGAFVADAPVYWGPDADLDIDLTIETGKTFYTFGVDESGEYRQILLVCDFVWVPVETMGPNYDDVWNGMPLPMDVVD